MFNKISIIGCGLIGSSILRAVEEKKLASKLSIFDRSSHVNSYLKKNFSSEVCSNISEAVINSDLTIIASPLSSYKEILLSIKANLKKDSINQGVVDYKSLVEGGFNEIAKNPKGDYHLYRVGDDVSSRNIHAAIYDSLRICKNI